MNGKYLVQFIVCVLLCFTARAGTQGFPVFYSQHAVYTVATDDDERVATVPETTVERNTEDAHMIKVRTRFRPGSSVSVPSVVTSSVTAVPVVAHCYQSNIGYSRCTLPTYYLFLFRLTPF